MFESETEQSFSKSKSRTARLIVSRYRADLPFLATAVEVDDVEGAVEVHGLEEEDWAKRVQYSAS